MKKNTSPPKPSFLFILLLFVFQAPIAHATTYFVATNGNDTNPGSQTSPFKTIQKAANITLPGDVVMITGGTYPEKITLTRSGTSTQYISFQNYNQEKVTIDAQNGIRNYGIDIAGPVGYLKFSGLTIQGANNSTLQSAGFRATVNSSGGAHDIIIDNLTVENCFFGFLLKGNKDLNLVIPVSNITIKNSVARNNIRDGVFIYYRVYNSTVGPNNHIYNNGIVGDNNDSYGINIDTDYPGTPVYGPKGITIINNEINNNEIQGIRPWNAQNLLIKDNYLHHNGATGIQVENGCQNVIVDGNRSEFNAQTYEYETGIWIDSTVNALVQNNRLTGNQIGLMVTDSNRILLRNNIIYQNNRGISTNIMGVMLNVGSSNIVFVHNTIWKNGVSGSRGNLAICSKPPLPQSVLKNNIFTESSGSYDIWSGCQVDSDFNNFYNSRSLLGNWFGSNLNWTSYSSTSQQDNHSNTTNPGLKDPVNGDFSLTSTSPDIDTGTFLTHALTAGNGNTINVEDSRYFSDGLTVTDGDLIRIGNNSAKITKINYASNSITIDKNLTWSSGENISYLYSGSAPDKGAIESGTTNINPTSSPIQPSATPTLPVAKPGDANLDGFVNEIDYTIWLNHYWQNTNNGLIDGDFNKDNRVDGIDYVIWLSNIK